MVESLPATASRVRSGLVSVTFRSLTRREIVDLAQSSHFEGIEWGGDIHVPPGDLTAAAEARQLTLEAELSVVSYGSYWRAEEHFEVTLRTAKALGAPNIRVWAGTQSSAQIDKSARSKIVETLRAACDSAASEGIDISLEYHSHTLTDTLVSTLKLLREVDRENLKTYWQPVPDRPHKIRIQEIQALRPHLSNLHVFQWTQLQGVTLRHRLVHGNHEWPDYLQAAGGNRFALLEFVPEDDPAIFSDEASTLRTWIKNLEHP